MDSPGTLLIVTAAIFFLIGFALAGTIEHTRAERRIRIANWDLARQFEAQNAHLRGLAASAVYETPDSSDPALRLVSSYENAIYADVRTAIATSASDVPEAHRTETRMAAHAVVRRHREQVLTALHAVPADGSPGSV